MGRKIGLLMVDGVMENSLFLFHIGEVPLFFIEYDDQILRSLKYCRFTLKLCVHQIGHNLSHSRAIIGKARVSINKIELYTFKSILNIDRNNMNSPNSLSVMCPNINEPEQPIYVSIADVNCPTDQLFNLPPWPLMNPDSSAILEA